MLRKKYKVHVHCDASFIIYFVRNKTKRVLHQFTHPPIHPEFMAFLLNGNALQFVSYFRYLGHMVNNKLSYDDDINREIRNLFMRTNILVRRYGKCSVGVKLALFRVNIVRVYMMLV